MTQRNRIWMIISVLVAILALIILSAGLPQLQLENGLLLNQQTINEFRTLIAQFGIFRGWLVFIFVIAPILLIFVVRRIRKPVPVELAAPRRKRSWTVIFIQAVMWAIAIMIIRQRLSEGVFNLTSPEGLSAPGITPGGNIQAITANVPDWLSYVSSIAILAMIFLVAWIIWRRRQESMNTLELVAQEAQFALDELKAGENLSDVILKCYYDMTRALDHHRGVRRKQDMTPREFETRLVMLGFPREPVRQLTRLFESVRYGAKRLGHEAEAQAVDCLDEIVKASGEAS